MSNDEARDTSGAGESDTGDVASQDQGQEDEHMTSIDNGDAGRRQADGESNTGPRPDSPGVIGSYTVNDQADDRDDALAEQDQDSPSSPERGDEDGDAPDPQQQDLADAVLAEQRQAAAEELEELDDQEDDGAVQEDDTFDDDAAGVDALDASTSAPPSARHSASSSRPASARPISSSSRPTSSALPPRSTSQSSQARGVNGDASTAAAGDVAPELDGWGFAPPVDAGEAGTADGGEDTFRALSGSGSAGTSTSARPGSIGDPPRPATSQQGMRPGTSQQGMRPGTSQQGTRPTSDASTTAAPGSASGLGGLGPMPERSEDSAFPPAPASEGSRPNTSQLSSRPAGSRPDSGGYSTSHLKASSRGASPATGGGSGSKPASAGLVQPPGADKYIAQGLRAIDVEVASGPGMPHKLLHVLIDYSQLQPKSYHGGFRNKRTGATYHHAVTQTPRQPKYLGAEPKLSRETQTVKTSTRSQQSKREQSTQIARPDVTVDTTYDREVVPGTYQTADERDQIVEAAVRTIQRNLRGYFGRKRAAYLMARKVERDSFLREQSLKALHDAEEHRRKEIQRRMHPRTTADFEILYRELEAWRLQEMKKIKDAGLDKDKEQAVLAQLLHKETKLLQTIDRLKVNAAVENKDSRVQRTLGEMAAPKRFELKNGGKAEVHTPFTTRAKELQQLYNGLNLPILTIDERLDVLLHVKWTVKEFDCNLTRELVELIDREADLLNRGRSPKTLEGLRKRISGAFLTFIETPEFNPEAARFQIVPLDFESYLFAGVSAH